MGSSRVSEYTRIAHRGFAGVAPENTVGAVAAVPVASTDLVEVDVRPSADGTPVCFHDEHLHETGGSRGITDGQGLVRETATEVVCASAVLGSGERVPTLTEFLAAVPDGVGVNVELKGGGFEDETFGRALFGPERDTLRERWRPFVASVVDVLDGFEGEILVSSFYEGAVAAMEAVGPRLDTAVLVWDSLVVGVEIAERYDVHAVHPPVNLVAGTRFSGTGRSHDQPPSVDLDIVAASGDRAVNVWTVRSWLEATELVDAGVDGLILDYPGIVPWTTIGVGGRPTRSLRTNSCSCGRSACS